MKKLLTILSSVFFVASCAISDFETPSAPTAGSGKDVVDCIGFFELTLSSVPATRATTTQITPEEAANFLVTIFKGNDIIRQTVRLGDLDTRLSAGYGYTVQAESCSEAEAESANDGWGQKRFAGLSASFAIKAGETTDVNVGCSVANAGVELTYDESLLDYFTSIEVTVKSGNRTLTFTKNGQTAYFNTSAESSRPATYTITATGANGTLTSEGTLDLSKAKMSRINLKYEIGTLDLSVWVDEADLTDDEVVISEQDIQTDDGKTEVNATFAGYAESARTEITAYGQANVSLAATSPIDWAQDDSKVAVYDYATEKREFPVSSAEGVQRLDGNMTPRTRDFLAAYPYSQAADALSEGKVVFTLPAEQFASAVAPGTELASSKMNYAVAKGQRSYDGSLLNLTFLPVCQVLQFQVPSYAAGRISAIQFTANTPVAGSLAVDMSGEKPSAAIASAGSNSITILPPSGQSTFSAGTYHILTAPVQMNGFSMTFECGDTDYTLSGTSTLGGEAGKLYPLGYVDLVNDVHLSNAGHVYEGGVLQGTSFQVNAPIPTQNWKATAKNSSGTVVRSYTGTDDFNSTYADASWPYLPKGDYTVDYSYTTSNGKQMAGVLSFSTTKPNNFGVTTTAYTSYSYYVGDVVAKNIASANACNNQTIYAPTVKITGISNAILNNSNYVFTIERSGFSSNQRSASNGVYVYNDFTQTEWKAYTLSAKVTFDGVEVSSNTQTVHLTGLPYNVKPPRNSGDHAWSVVQGGNKVDWESSYLSMGDGGTVTSDPTVKSPTFYIPGTINVNIGSTGVVFTRNVLFDYHCTLTMYLASGEIASQKSSSTSGNSYSFNVTGKSMTSSNNYIRFSTNTRTELSGYARINTVSVTYR